ncbi:rRNA methyltransferase 3A, mitochondrial-like isoform X1 [Argonauta hians]
MAVCVRRALLLSSQLRPRFCFSQGKHSSVVHRPIVKEISPEEQRKQVLIKQGFFHPSDKNVNKRRNFNTREDKLSEERKHVTVSEKLSDSDPRFGPEINIAKSRKTRYKKKKIFLEGKRLIIDALESGAKCLALYITSGVEPFQLPPQHADKFPIYKVQYKSLKLWSDVVTPAGIAAIFAMPEPGDVFFPQTESIPLTLILDNIQDGGNMGALIRSAAAVGCSKVLASVGCVDIWEPKVLRSGCGAHFRIPIINNITWKAIPNYLSGSPQILLASTLNHDTQKSLSTCQFEDIDQLIKLSENEEESDAEDSETAETEESDSSMVLPSEEDIYHRVPLPNNVYHQTSCSEEEIVLVVGNEAHGLSAEAKKFAFKNYGQYVSIPLANGVDSLNSIVAASVFMFEIRKQLKTSNRI